MQGIDDSWLSRETTADITSTGIGNWNQFDANSSKFGIKSSYDENLYTKKLDKSSITRWQLRKAEKLARAIESKSFHIFIYIKFPLLVDVIDLTRLHLDGITVIVLY